MMSEKLLGSLVEHSGWVEQPPGVNGLHVSAALLQKGYPKYGGLAGGLTMPPAWNAYVARSWLSPMLWPTSWIHTCSQPKTQPLIVEYMRPAAGEFGTHAMPLPPKPEPSRRKLTMTAPYCVRSVSMFPKTAPLKAPLLGVMELSAVVSSLLSKVVLAMTV